MFKLNVVLLFAFTIFISGCTTHQVYRDKVEVCNGIKKDIISKCKDYSFQKIEDESGYDISFVEFDDTGNFAKREQMNLLLKDLEDRAFKENFLIVLFAHGWKHNAKEGDQNIKDFRKILVKLSKKEEAISKANSKKPRKVLGVYLGWRGESIAVEPLSTMLTFWERKDIALKVGRSATELLVRLNNFVNLDHELTNSNLQSDSRFIIMGHSFGGQLIYSALSQIVIDKFISGSDGKGITPSKFGDLIMLINPAFEANQFRVLKEMSDSRKYFDGQQPIMMILTSKRDYATKYAFPAGRWLSTFFEQDFEYQNKIAIGHYKPFKTHELYKLKNSQNINAVSLDEAKNKDRGLVFEDSKLICLNDTKNPFFVVAVDNNVISGHSGIYKDVFLNFIDEFFTLSILEEGKLSPCSIK